MSNPGIQGEAHCVRARLVLVLRAQLQKRKEVATGSQAESGRGRDAPRATPARASRLGARARAVPFRKA